MIKKKKKKSGLEHMTQIHRVRGALLSMALRLMKLPLPPGFENSTQELQRQLSITADSLKKAADVLEAELIDNDPAYAEIVRKRSR